LPLFSQRKGLKPVRTVIQKDDMDEVLRNGLWTALQIRYWSMFSNASDRLSYYSDLSTLMQRLWHSYFKKPIDPLPFSWRDAVTTVRDYFFKCPWYEVYDFIEFVANNYPNGYINGEFTAFSNGVLEREMSAYRFVSGQVTEITSEQEILAIETAIKQSPRASSAHLDRALGLMSDRKSPDYRNSIKESYRRCNVDTRT
jgi:hypothetical protein